MAKYFVFYYSEVTSKSSGEVYCNIDFVPDDDKERVMSVSIKRSDLFGYDGMQGITPENIKKNWFEVYSYWNNQYKTRYVNGIRRIGPKA